jgi:hypothetical protein
MNPTLSYALSAINGVLEQRHHDDSNSTVESHEMRNLIERFFGVSFVVYCPFFINNKKEFHIGKHMFKVKSKQRLIQSKYRTDKKLSLYSIECVKGDTDILVSKIVTEEILIRKTNKENLAKITNDSVANFELEMVNSGIKTEEFIRLLNIYTELPIEVQEIIEENNNESDKELY